MKITVEIPDAHAGDLFQFLASLSARPVEASTDPAPGHPELPLMLGTPDDEGDLRWSVAGELEEPVRAATQTGRTHALAEWARWVADGMPRKNRSGPDPLAADPLKVAMDDVPPVTQPEIGTRS